MSDEQPPQPGSGNQPSSGAAPGAGPGAGDQPTQPQPWAVTPEPPTQQHPTSDVPAPDAPTPDAPTPGAPTPGAPRPDAPAPDVTAPHALPAPSYGQGVGYGPGAGPAPAYLPPQNGPGYGPPPAGSGPWTGSPPPGSPPYGSGTRVPGSGGRRALLVAAVAGAVLLVGSAGFAVGRATSHSRTDFVSPAGQAVPGGRLGDGAGGGAGGVPGYGDDFRGQGLAIGQVASVGKASFTMTTRQGSTVTVKTTSSTRVNQSTNGSLSGLKAGDVVLVRGTRNSDGSITASVVVSRPTVGSNGPGNAGTGGQPGGQVDGTTT